MFQVALRNRVPALDWVHYPNPFSDDYDILIIENSTKIITPQGYDPDQDKLTYTYSGWKADYIEKYTFSGNRFTSTQTPLTDNLLEQSEPYLKTKKDVEISAGHDDIGPHNITLTLTDEAGNQDYQVIRVLVNDIPLVDLKTDNMFSEISNNLASIEDPYKIDASGTTSIFTTGLSYIFEDSLEGTMQDSSESIVYVPEMQPDINTIKQRIFKQTGSHTITLRVTDNFFGAQAIGVKEEKVEVKECLAHRNQNTAPYPYNYIPGRNDGYSDETNPYLADHTCCSPTNKPYTADDKVSCYDTSDYGAWDADSDAENYYNALDTVNKKGIKYLDPSGKETELDTLKSSYPNAVIKRTFKRYCGGDRGNICGGAGELTVQVYEDCGGFTKGAQERCSGPNKNIIEKAGPTNPGCENYEGISFEELTGQSVNDGICNTNFRCSSEGNGGNYFNEGAFYCQASCSGGYCSKAVNCNCKEGCTGAECDSLNDRLLSGEVCKYSCSLTTCTYKSSNCPARAITTTASVPQSSNTKEHDLNNNEYCYVRQDCSSTGCTMETNILKKGYCDSCIANIGVVSGEQCAASDYCPRNCPNSGVFYYNPSCTGVQNTVCSIQKCNYGNGYITRAASPHCICDDNECKRDCQDWLENTHPDWEYVPEATSCINSNTWCKCGYRTQILQPPTWTNL